MAHTARLLLAASFLSLLVAPALAQDIRASGDVQAVSDYRNRGISRSDEHPALQGRVQVEHTSGIYAGAGASTVDLRMDSDANVEGILFGGYKGNYDGIEYDAKIGYTAYPGGNNDNLDYWDFSLVGGYDFDVFYASMTWAFSPNYINDSGASFYYGGDIVVPLMDTWSARGHLGYQYVNDEGPYINSSAADWSLGVWYNWVDYDVDLGLQYVDTNLDDNECVEKCGSRAVFSVGKDFSF